MPELSRRSFLTRGSVAVAAGTVATAVPGIGSILTSAPAQATENKNHSALTDAEAGAADRDGPLVAQVSDIRSGEISVYRGKSRVVLKNPAIVAQLYRAIPQQGR